MRSAALVAGALLVACFQAPSLASGGTIRATCESFAAVARQAPAGATVRLRGDCGLIQLHGRKTPLTVDATGARMRGLWLMHVRDVTWRGGTVEAPKGRNGENFNGYGGTLEWAERVTIEGVTFANAYRGLVTRRENSDITIRNNRFTDLRSDGLNLTGVTRGLVEGNRFESLSPIRSTCTFPDGRVEGGGWNRRVCEGKGGRWADGDHSDCIQMWGTLVDVTVRGNVINTPAPNACQGITTFGQRQDRYTRVQILDNEVITDDWNGIAVGACTDCLIRGNKVRAATREFADRPYIRTYGEPAVALCGNDVTGPHPKQRIGTERCRS
ncbi:right-handed parallel beta-helix repeat-containing protein [Thermaurantiacus sp.]